MKRLYAQLQKEQLRKLKAAVSMAPTSGREKPKGFVPHTLVKVVCEGTSTAKTLKVGGGDIITIIGHHGNCLL